MHKYTRKYYINNSETTLEITLKYIEIMLTHHDKQMNELNISFEDVYE